MKENSPVHQLGNFVIAPGEFRKSAAPKHTEGLTGLSGFGA